MLFKITIFVLIMLAYAIGFVFKRLQEQAALKRAKEAQERRMLEALRTGRVEDPDHQGPVVVSTKQASPAPVGHQEATRRLQEMAERRRMQLEELRRRAAGQARTGTTPPAAPAMPPQAPAPAPVRQAPARPATPAGRATARPQPQRRAATRPQPARGARQRPSRPSGEVVREEEVRRRPITPEVEVREAAAAAAAVAGARLPIGRLTIPSGKAGAAELRRILVLREILDPPVALRDQQVQ